MKSKLLQEQLKTVFKSKDFMVEFIDLMKIVKEENKLINSPILLEKLSSLKEFINLVDETYSKLELKTSNQSIDRSSSNNFLNNNISNSYVEIQSLLNALDEGYLIIGPDGASIEASSKMAKKILGKDPTGEQLANIITIPQESKDSFQEWLKMVFMEAIPFKELARLAPKGFHFGNIEKLIEVKFKPIRKDSGSLHKIVMMLSDNSSLFEAEKIIGEQKLFTDMVIKYLNDKPNFIRLIHTTRETADSLNSWSFNNVNEIHEQTKLLSERLNYLKLELNNFSMYSLGYKIHQIEDEISTFFKVNSNPQDGENLLHLLGQEISDSLSSFLNKYRHIFVFDNNTSQTKEIPVESIYRFCAELMRMGLTDLLDYYIEEIVAVPFASLFAPIEARIYSQSLSQDSTIEYHLHDPKKVRVIPEFYSFFFEQLVPILNFIINQKNIPGASNSKIDINLDILSIDRNQKIEISISYSIDLDKEKTETLNKKEESLFVTLNQSIANIGGTLNVHPINNHSGKFVVLLPYVGEINSDVLDWINQGGPESGANLRTVG